MYSVKKINPLNRLKNASDPAPCFIKPYVELYDGDRIAVIQITIALDGKPCRPKILEAIAQTHPTYCLACWWIPE